MQNAQPTTLGHYLLSYTNVLIRDFDRCVDVFSRVNQNPLGSAAFAGTGFNIDRHLTSELLGFNKPMSNSMDAVATADFLIESLTTISILGINLSRLCEDLIIWNTQEFDYIELDDAYAGSSSIMPQKKNPNVLERIRSISGTIGGIACGAMITTKGLTMSFNLDLLETRNQTPQAIELIIEALVVLSEVIDSITFNKSAMEENADNGFSTATELADLLVKREGIGFRTAHHIVAHIAKNYDKESIDSSILGESAIDIADVTISIKDEEIQQVLDPKHHVNLRNSYGGPGEITSGLRRTNNTLNQQRDIFNDCSQVVQTATKAREKAINILDNGSVY